MNFFSTSEELATEIRKIASPLLSNNRNILPDWLSEDKQLIFKKSLIVCGTTSKEEIRALAKNFNIISIVDDDLSKKWQWLYGIPLISTSKWIDIAKSNQEIISLVLVGTLRAYRHFIKQSIQHSLKYLTPLQILHILRDNNVQVIPNGLISRYGLDYFDFALCNLDELIDQRTIFVDEYSKISYLNILCYKLTLNPFYLENTAVGRGNHYDYNTYLFERTYLQLENDEVYVDAGAFTGDSLQCFLFAVKGQFKHIYSFEPDEKNNDEIRKRITKLQQFYLKPLQESISIIEKGVWSKDEILHFSTAMDHDLGGHIVETGMNADYDRRKTVSMAVTSIDAATNQDATFIKYEVEGSELEALVGAQKTIVKNKPKLAVALYHKAEDILTLPKYLRNLDMDYKIGFRQHDPYKPDATYCYCS